MLAGTFFFVNDVVLRSFFNNFVVCCKFLGKFCSSRLLFFLRKVMVECVYFPAQKILFPADVALHTCLSRREKWLSTPLFRLSSWVVLQLQYYYYSIFHWWKALIICIYMQHMIINQRCYYILRRMHKINIAGP